MIAILSILAIGYFALLVYLLYLHGPKYFPWPALIYAFVYLVIAAITRTIDDFSVVVLPIIFSPIFARFTVFFIQRTQAGNRILTYKRSMGSSIVVILVTVVLVFFSFVMSIPHKIKVPSGGRIYDEAYYQDQLPLSIVIGLMGLGFFTTIFRKGEFYDDGLATPDLQYFPWNGYEYYFWSENANKQSDKRISLSLKGGSNYSHTIHGLSESTKTILEEFLSTKLKKLPEAGKS